MKWLWIIVAILIPVGLIGLTGIIWIIGSYVLAREGYKYIGTPSIYDGKEPFAQWAAKMSAAREAQRKEYDDDV